MKEQYDYTKIKDVEEFLHAYTALYKEDLYQTARALAVTRLFPKINKQTKILELGCGGGFYSLTAAKMGGKEIVVTDLERGCVKAAKLNLLRNNCLRVEGIVTDATKLPLQNESFHTVLCIDLVEHINKEETLIQETHRILKNQGKLLIATQNSSSLNYLLEGFVRRKVLKNPKWMGWDKAHVRFYNPQSIFTLLKSQGFQITKIAGTYFIPYCLLRWQPFQRLSQKASQATLQLLSRLNQIFETRGSGTPWNIHGWGIICQCSKMAFLREQIKEQIQ